MVEIKQGYKKTKIGWIPIDWQVKRFEDISKVDNVNLASTTPEDYEFKYITLSDVDKGYLINALTKYKFIEAPSRARRIVSKGDVLMATVRPNLQSFFFVKNEVQNLIASTGFAIISANSHSCGEYIYHYLYSRAISSQLYALVVGSNYPAINSNDVKKLKIHLPPLPEQKKIAQILSTWDRAIETTQKLIAAKEQQKKGLMQQLLTGKKRFREFVNEKWQELSLNDFLIPSFREINKPNNKFLALGIRSHCKGTFLKPDSEPDKIAMDKLYVVKTNDLIVNITFAWEGAIAIVKKEDHGALVSHRFPTYTFNTNIAISEFFKYIIIQKRFRYILGLISPGGAGRNRVLSKKDFLKIKWLIPQLNEQQKIAAVFQTADKEIELLKQKLTALQQQKKGLMQVLLTGKVRVKI